MPATDVLPLLTGDESSCSICLCQFEDSEDAKLLPCQHMFHTLCIHTWLNKVCTINVLDTIFSRSYCYTVWSAIGISVLSVRLSVTLCIVALRVGVRG